MSIIIIVRHLFVAPFANTVLNMWKEIAIFFVYSYVAVAENCDTDQRLAVMEAKLDLMVKKCKLIYKLTNLRAYDNVTCVHENHK